MLLGFVFQMLQAGIEHFFHPMQSGAPGFLKVFEPLMGSPLYIKALFHSVEHTQCSMFVPTGCLTVLGIAAWDQAIGIGREQALTNGDFQLG